MSSLKRGAALGAAICALTCANASAAATFVVDKTADDAGAGACTPAPNDCSLRSAIQAANVDTAADTITLAANTYHVDTAQETITKPVTITGAGARSTTIDGDGAAAPLLSFNVSDVASVSDLTIADSGSASFTGVVDVSTAAPLTLTRVAVVGNASVPLLMNGGNVQVRSSLIAHNSAEAAGAIINQGGSSGLLSVVDSTIADNTALPAAPEQPLAFTGGIVVTGIASIVNSTIAGNQVDPSAYAFGGDNLLALNGSSTAIGVIHVSNSIVAGASANGNCSGEVQTGGHNLDSDGTCGFHAINDHPGVDPLLVALANNGGPTDTLALSANSPAVDTGAGCGATDQRGVARPAGGACDIGAFESPFTAPVVTPPGTPPTTPPPTTPPATTPPADTTPPQLSVAGIAKTVTRKAFNKGLKVKVGANEPIAAELTLLATPRSVTIAKVPSLVLASKSLARAAGTRTVTLKPSAKLKGTRKVKMQLRVVAFDAAGNRSAKTVSFTVK